MALYQPQRWALVIGYLLKAAPVWVIPILTAVEGRAPRKTLGKVIVFRQVAIKHSLQ